MNTSRPLVSSFLLEHKLPSSYAQLIDLWFQPLADSIYPLVAAKGLGQNSFSKNEPSRNTPLFVGINGAQGSGKTTLASYLRADLNSRGLNVVVMSIDDFYLTYAQRQTLAESKHSLLATRGVPGTHDLALLESSLKSLLEFPSSHKTFEEEPPPALLLPTFDKSRDDRQTENNWQVITQAVDVIILEGWCVGAMPQQDEELGQPVNSIESKLDPDLSWRKYVNAQLAAYQSVFAQLDQLIMLKAPSFEQVFDWRLQQEQKLMIAANHANQDSEESPKKIMNKEQVRIFIQYYQRITEHCLREIPSRATHVFYLNQAQHVVAKIDRS